MTTRLFFLFVCFFNLLSSLPYASAAYLPWELNICPLGFLISSEQEINKIFINMGDGKQPSSEPNPSRASDTCRLWPEFYSGILSDGDGDGVGVIL